MAPLRTFARDNASGSSRIRTNQKIKFDIDISGKLMGIGDEVRHTDTFVADTK
jgi:hypothetical protein